MSTSVATSIELPVGYTVVDRLGAGGYGEVWKATAPGGVEKAIKIVFGHCDEGMAERELKSLERIRSVRHPFVLSIERYEIVNNRLVIVTELADMSLSDCFQNYLNDGHSGIPRDQLIAYMWDAAEALDCLVEQHSLQHLDIKPENLLVVGDHIKVADFGLVKELASKTLNSMMGGMTPLYSAPEIYDNNPTKFSDQYSLAIVYQQMLTGSLPFPGRTPAQLAKQHTLSEPNLNQLSEADQRIVGRALAKTPTDRFSNCREFIDALRTAGQPNPSKANATSSTKGKLPPNDLDSDDTKSASMLDTKQMEDPVCAAATQVLSEINGLVDTSTISLDSQPAKVAPRRFPRFDSTIEEIETPALGPLTATQPIPTLFIGVGGMGIKMLRTTRNQASANCEEAMGRMAWLAIDTERDSLKSPTDGETRNPLSSEEKLHIPLRRPNEYRDDSQALLQWVSRRWLYNIPRSLQTRGFRPLGRIAIVDHAEEVFSALHNRLQWLATNDPGLAENSRPIHVVLLAGMCGGTGGGTVIDLAQAVRSICQEFSQEVVIHGVLASTYHMESTDSLAAANMYSLLAELSHTQQTGNCGESPPPGTAARYELPQRPFDEVYAVAIPTRSDRASCELSLQSIANYLLLEASGSVESAVDAIRLKIENPPEHAFLRTFTCINLDELANSFRTIHQQLLSKAILEHWLAPCQDNSDADLKYFQEYASSHFASTVLSQLPKPAPKPLPKTIKEAEDPGPSAEEALRTKKIKCIAAAFSQFIDSFEFQGPNDQGTVENAEVLSASNRILTTLGMVLKSQELQEAEMVQVLSELLGEAASHTAADSSEAKPSELAASALSMLEKSPLNCGHRRRTVLIAPCDNQDPGLIESLRQACPTLADFKTSVPQPYLLQEGSELSPLNLGARLAEMYPDIDEAGGRLHTRSDIQWRDLRDNL
ncbi:protein kinase domain-containing protein [Bythopirellula goksoeyrii]|uniref:Tubulin-like protein n=1 Tax=Bythopirellula goksoeyrii TaxID=1400387 RepID=A0A5B9QAG8_9BACT|nr:tubulin-like doman-containing protein [Bythopirellula goksoeyrii]QEG34452.1 Tubulin-like protein [Bythopirellula goksoeyrii]